MKKGLIIKLAIVLVVLVLSYCVFWFYKAGQSEKQINKFIADNSANISAGEISVTGFPVGQKIIVSDLKITVPVNLVAKRQIIIKQLEATSGIFSNDFVVNLVDAVKIQDLENSGDVFDVEFAGKSEIMLSLLGGSIAKFQYSDSGFKILDAEKNVVNSSSGLSILSENSVDEADKRINKINISFKELEGYAVIDFYKNVLEKKVIEGIKTEEIKVNVAPVVDQANFQQFTTPLSQEQALAMQNNIPGQPPVMDPMQAVPPAPPAPPAPSVAQVPNGQNVAVQAMVNEAVNNGNGQAQQVPVVNPAQLDNNQVPPAPTNIDPNAPMAPEVPLNAVVKNNITIDIIITLTPSVKQEQAETPPADPTQIQELPVQYVQNIKINNVELTNDLFKINITGDVTNSSDDNYPSGGITVKVEKISNLVNQLKGEFRKLSEAKKPSVPSNGADLINDQSQQQNQVQNYDIFLNNISEKLTDISNEIALKNSASKDEIAQFDVRREKNLEFLVNEVSVREIVGKF
jgi:hypothetical protein